MKEYARKALFTVKPYVAGRPIDEVKREYKLDSVIKLASNENPYAPSPKVIRAITQAAKTINRYPDGGCYCLRQAVAKKVAVSPEQLIFGNGSDELIALAIRAFVNEGDGVVISEPTFLEYSIAAKLAGARLVVVPSNNFRYDLDGMRRAITPRTKVIFLGNPDNPAGMYFSQKEMEQFLKVIPQNVLVFIDEAYYEYVDEKDYVDSVRLIRKHANVVVARTFSKMYGLAGLRIGYGIAQPAVIDILNRVREPFNVNSIAQAAAVACLQDAPYYRDIAKKIREQRAYLCQQLTALQVPFVTGYTNFILINVGKATAVVERLMRTGVIVRDMSHWGMDTFIRVTIGTPAENKRFIKELQGII